MRPIAFFALALALLPLSGCGYHTLARATHCRPGKHARGAALCHAHRAYRTETVMTQAVIREFATRTRLRVTPDANGDPDAVLHGTILKEVVSPLTYNSTRSSRPAPHHHGRFGHAQRRDEKFSTKQELRSSASSISPPPIFPASSRRIRLPSSGFRASLRGSWWPMCWKDSSETISHNEKRRGESLLRAASHFRRKLVYPTGAEHQYRHLRADAVQVQPFRRICRFVTVFEVESTPLVAPSR